MARLEHDPVRDLPHALGAPLATARLRAEPGDFRVEELMAVPAHETGAHWWLQITKTGMNTRDVVRVLAELGTAKARQIGYAGLKDRHAVTTQWFSLPIEHLVPASLAGRLPESLQLLDWKRARHAIRRGGLLGNRFTLRLRSLVGDRQDLEKRLDHIVAGVPNYFGEQRFGIGGANLQRARRLFDGSPGDVPRFERGMYLSAARAQLFNLVLAHRVRSGTWNQLMDGEAVILDGSRSWFPLDDDPKDLDSRLAEHDIHPSGPLHGVGEPAPRGACAELERSVLESEAELAEGLVHLRMRAERRSLRLVPRDLAWEWRDAELVLSFSLPKGTFATSVLRELIRGTDPE